MNQTFEIVILFLTVASVLLIAKRNIFGILLYLVPNILYYGINLEQKVKILIDGGKLSLEESSDMMFAMIGLILPIAVLLDWLLDKNRKANPKDKKTDWFYKNEEFDRKLDERADKNNYRTM